MKNQFKITLIIFWLFSIQLNAQKSSTVLIDKIYTPANKATVLKVNNSFGNINIATWDKNTIQVKITLELEGYNDKEIENFKDKVKFDQSETANIIAFESGLKGNNISITGKKSIQINYEINMPKEHPLNLSNSFGNILLPDYEGVCEIAIEYGNLTAGKLNNLELELEFGKGEVEKIVNGNLDLSYADHFEIREAGRLTINSEFSKFSIETIDELKLDAEYGSISISKVNQFTGGIEFSGLNIGLVNRVFDVDGEYVSGALKIDKVSKEIEIFKLNLEFSKAEITLEKGLQVRFESKHSFGSLKTKGISAEFTEKVKDSFDERFKGTIGSGKLNNTIFKLSSTYGDITLITE